MLGKDFGSHAHCWSWLLICWSSAIVLSWSQDTDAGKPHGSRNQQGRGPHFSTGSQGAKDYKSWELRAAAPLNCGVRCWKARRIVNWRSCEVLRKGTSGTVAGTTDCSRTLSALCCRGSIWEYAGWFWSEPGGMKRRCWILTVLDLLPWVWGSWGRQLSTHGRRLCRDGNPFFLVCSGQGSSHASWVTSGGGRLCRL